MKLLEHGINPPKNRFLVKSVINLWMSPSFLLIIMVRWWALLFIQNRIAVSKSLTDNTKKLLKLYDLFPFHRHPLWLAIINKELTLEQVIQAECQHYLRTKAGQRLRK